MTRRSVRVKEKVEASGSESNAVSATYSEETDDFDVDGSNSEDEFIIRPKKRSKTLSSARDDDNEKHVQKNSRGKWRILQELTEMPLPILFEIFRQLCPVDLLNLARTTKALRAVLMSRSAITVWQQGRKTNLPGLPDCPKDLSEPQYADLLFGSNCQACLASKSQAIVWGLLIRLCSTCIDGGFLNWNTSRYRYPQLPTDIAEMVPKVSVNSFQGKKCLEKVFHDETQRRWLQEYQKLSNEIAISAWRSELQSDYTRVSAFTVRCEGWLDQQAKSRVHELEQVQLQRKNDIFNRLRELGWGDELEHPEIISQLESHFLVKQKKALTNRIWTNMKPTILELMEKAKATRLSGQEIKGLKQAYAIIKQLREKFDSTCSPNIVVPPVTDILYFEPFQSVVLANANLTSEHFGEAMKQLPQFCKVWQEERDRELVAMIQKALPDTEVDRTHLLLATTFFKSEYWSAEEPLCYPHVFTYPPTPCRETAHSKKTAFLKHPHWRVNLRNSSIPESIRNFRQKISFHNEAYKHAITVIRTCHFNPRTTTVEIIDADDPILECLLCTTPGVRCCMTWRRAVYHASSMHKSAEVSWNLLDEPFAEEIRRRIVEAQIGSTLKSLKSHYSEYRCAHCKERFHLDKLQQHLFSKHDKTTYSSEDFIKILDEDYTPPSVYHIDTKGFL